MDLRRSRNPRKPKGSVTAKPHLVPQPHGGALKSGGTPGNRGGTLRAEVRRDALRLVAERLPLLAHAADGVAVEINSENGMMRVVSPSPRERTQALALLWHIADGSRNKITAHAVRKRLVAQVGAIREMLSPDLAEAVLSRLAEIWR